MVYAGITRGCVSRLLALVASNVSEMESDKGPYWLCLWAVLRDLRAEIARTRKHFEVKMEYGRQERIKSLIEICEGTNRVLADIEKTLAGSFFRVWLFLRDFLKYEFVRRFNAPGCRDLTEGQVAIATLRGIQKRLQDLNAALMSKVPEVYIAPNFEV